MELLEVFIIITRTATPIGEIVMVEASLDREEALDVGAGHVENCKHRAVEVYEETVNKAVAPAEVGVLMQERYGPAPQPEAPNCLMHWGDMSAKDLTHFPPGTRPDAPELALGGPLPHGLVEALTKAILDAQPNDSERNHSPRLFIERLAVLLGAVAAITALVLIVQQVGAR